MDPREDLSLNEITQNEKPYEVFGRGGHFVGRYATQVEAMAIATECSGTIRVLSGCPVLPSTFTSMLHDSLHVGWDSARRT